MDISTYKKDVGAVYVDPEGLYYNYSHIHVSNNPSVYYSIAVFECVNRLYPACVRVYDLEKIP